MATSPDRGDLKRSRGPESSLTWCLAHLAKPGPGPGPDCGKELDKKGRLCQWRALLAIRTDHIKGDKAGITRFRSQGGLRPLLDLLRRPQCSRKTLDLALSILANCCTEPETREEVREMGGVDVLAEILKRNVALETVQNRAARALGNLAMDPEGSTVVHSAGAVPLLLVCVSLSSGPSSPSAAAATPLKEPCPKLECAQSAVRALLYLSDTPPHRLALITQGALPALAPLLAPEFPAALRRAALRTLHELTRGCGPECAREVSRSGVLTQLGAMAAPDAANRAFEELALKTLANVCSQGCLRPLVGSLGVIGRFAQEARKEPPKSGVFFKALCLCCKEAVNRAKVKEGGGLEVLTGFLAAHRRHPLARLAILACVDFVFDESAMEQLQELGLVPLLVGLLVELAGGDQDGGDRLDPGSSSPSDLLPSSCFDSFDFPPPPDGCRREEVSREQGGLCSSSFLSLRSWLLSEGLISSEGDLLDSSGVEVEWGGLHLPPSSSPQTSSSSPNPDSCCSSVRNTSPPLASKRLSSSTGPSPSPGPTPSTGPSSSPGPSPSKFSSPHRRRQRVPSTPSLASVTLEAPPPAPRPSPYLHPYHPEPWTPESPILLLLSRFSHAADPSAALVSSGAAAGLLRYLSLHPEPSGRCLRLLHRLSCNPNCLQALLRTGAVALIQHHLCRGAQGEGQGRQSERVRTKVRQLGLSLLSNLRVQCESAFGAGVLAHVMLSGSDSERMNCALSLPLISSNKPLLKRLLVDGGGLLLALQPLGQDADQGSDEEEDEEEEEHSTECSRQLLSGWSSLPLSCRTTRLHSLYCSLLTGCLSGLAPPPPTVTQLDRKCHGLTPPLSAASPAPSSPPLCKRPRLADCCPYSLAAFDLVLLLDDGTRVPASRGHVVGGGTSAGKSGASEYFCGLLSGGFGEARSHEDIRIRDVSSDMLLPVLHFLHGCRLAQGGGTPDHLTQGGGRCRVLDRLFSPMESQEAPFQDLALGQAMVGASRFLVPDLQGALEELSITLLLNSSWIPESAEENLAARTSELELMETSVGEKVAGGQGGDGGGGGGGGGGGTAALAGLLPQLYCFSQRHSYAALGRACLSLLLAGRGHQGELLRRLVKEAHCVEALRQDLLRLAAASLS